MLKQKGEALAVLNGLTGNGHLEHEPAVEQLNMELPVVHDGQVPLGDLLSRVMQAIYAELSELAETLPNMSDAARKRTIADWVVKTKKQVVKLYAVTKWARDADTVQKCMNITAFLMNQNQQLESVIHGLTYARESLDSARLRNHDLLTSLDVLTSGTYKRLPSGIKKSIIPIPPMSDDEVIKTLSDMEEDYAVPSSHDGSDTRGNVSTSNWVHFTVPGLFETSVCMRGAEKNDGWFFVNVKFLISVGGDMSGANEFPREPTSVLTRHITDEADSRMACYLPLPKQMDLPETEVPERPRLPEGTVDAPLVRLYNFLQMMSLSYQLQILWYQAMRMCSLGWGQYLKVELLNSNKTLSVSYWLRPTPTAIPGRAQPLNRLKLPPHGGTLTISIIENRASPKVGGGPARSPTARMLSELQLKAKLGSTKPSDEVEGLKFEVKWEPIRGTLGVAIDRAESMTIIGELSVDSNNLDFEAMLHKVINAHARAILKVFQSQLQRGPTRNVFSPEGKVVLDSHGGYHVLRAHLCADEVVLVSIDIRTGRMNLRDTGDLAAASRGPNMYGNMIMEDIGWLDIRRIRGEKGPSEVAIGPRVEDPQVGQKRKRAVPSSAHNTLRREDNFHLETQTLRELYAYFEAQFKLRGIPYTHVNPTSSDAQYPCHTTQLVVGQEGSGCDRIIYDATEAVVSFLSEQVDTCVDEFLEEWARVSKMVDYTLDRLAAVTRQERGMGWWRVLYGDLSKRIAILDASYSLFQGNVVSPSQPDSDLERIGLEPIPDFRSLVLDARVVRRVYAFCYLSVLFFHVLFFFRQCFFSMVHLLNEPTSHSYSYLDHDKIAREQAREDHYVCTFPSSHSSALTTSPPLMVQTIQDLLFKRTTQKELDHRDLAYINHTTVARERLDTRKVAETMRTLTRQARNLLSLISLMSELACQLAEMKIPRQGQQAHREQHNTA
ncbi:mediator complex subunit MED14-domain-containing protein, partial [Butyriboletus roseoflavus]